MTDSREALTPRDIPIIFSGAMIRALLDGRKQQTRRLAWRKPSEEFREYVSQVGAGIPGTISGKPSPWQKVKPGDRLWVRENWWHPEPYSYGTTPGGCEIECPKMVSKSAPVHFAADGPPPNCHNRHYGPEGLKGGYFAAPDPWAVWTQRPSIHMPRWASRLTLIVTATKIERLQDISASDAQAEGVPTHVVEHTFRKCYRDDTERAAKRVEYFRDLWTKLHGAAAWDANPEVVAISFTVHQTNIDQLAQVAA